MAQNTPALLNLIVNYIEPKYLINFFLQHNIPLTTQFTYSHTKITQKSARQILPIFPSINLTIIPISKIPYLGETPVSYADLIPVSLSKYSNIKKIIYTGWNDSYHPIDISPLLLCTNLKYISFPICSKIIGNNVFENNTSLTRICITYIDCSNAKSPPPYPLLIFPPNLQHLVISGDMIPPNLSILNTCTKLHHLILNNTSYCEESHDEISIENFHIPTLTTLTIFYSGTIHGTPQILPNLKKLYLSKHSAIPFITSFSHITHLCLSLFNLSLLPNSITFPHLKYLKLDNCHNIKSIQLHTICPSIVHMKIHSVIWTPLHTSTSDINFTLFTKLKKISINDPTFDITNLNNCTNLTLLLIDNCKNLQNFIPPPKCVVVNNMKFISSSLSPSLSSMDSSVDFDFDFESDPDSDSDSNS